MNDRKYFLNYYINISIIIRFKQYFPSIVQSVEFTGRVARQNYGLYILRMIVKLAYMPRGFVGFLANNSINKTVNISPKCSMKSL